jgi:exonuclease-1
MGVKGLLTFLRSYEKKVEISSIVKDCSVGIDLFWFIHKSKGNLLWIQDYLEPMIKNATHIYCVVDGKTKKDHVKRKEARIEREKIEDHLETIRDYVKLNKETISKEEQQVIQCYTNTLYMQSWFPTKQYIDYVIKWLENQGCIIRYASYDADQVLVNLEKEGLIHYIISNDSDMLVLGGHTMIHMYNKNLGGLLSRDDLCQELNLTQEQWNDFMYMCECIKTDDILLVYSFIRVYKELDYALQKYDLIYPTRTDSIFPIK